MFDECESPLDIPKQSTCSEEEKNLVCDAVEVTSPPVSPKKRKKKKKSAHDHDWTMIMLAIALDIHSVLAGLGLGCESAAEFFPIFGAIVAHKGFAGFALGVTMAKTHRPIWILLLIGFIFAISTPTGNTAFETVPNPM